MKNWWNQKFVGVIQNRLYLSWDFFNFCFLLLLLLSNNPLLLYVSTINHHLVTIFVLHLSTQVTLFSSLVLFIIVSKLVSFYCNSGLILSADSCLPAGFFYFSWKSALVLTCWNVLIFSVLHQFLVCSCLFLFLSTLNGLHF